MKGTNELGINTPKWERMTFERDIRKKRNSSIITLVVK